MSTDTAWNAARFALLHHAGQARTRQELAELYADLAKRAPTPEAQTFWRDAAQRCRNGWGDYGKLPTEEVRDDAGTVSVV